MIYFLSANWKDSFTTVGERLFLGLTMTLVGIVIVVIILALVNLMVNLLSRIINGRKMAQPAIGTKTVSTEPVKSVSSLSEEPDKDETESDDAVIAAITSAVGYMLSDEEKPSAGFLIRKIRRV